MINARFSEAVSGLLPAYFRADTRAPLAHMVVPTEPPLILVVFLFLPPSPFSSAARASFSTTTCATSSTQLSASGMRVFLISPVRFPRIPLSASSGTSRSMELILL